MPLNAWIGRWGPTRWTRDAHVSPLDTQGSTDVSEGPSSSLTEPCALSRWWGNRKVQSDEGILYVGERQRFTLEDYRVRLELGQAWTGLISAHEQDTRTAVVMNQAVPELDAVHGPKANIDDCQIKLGRAGLL